MVQYALVYLGGQVVEVRSGRLLLLGQVRAGGSGVVEVVQGIVMVDVRMVGVVFLVGIERTAQTANIGLAVLWFWKGRAARPGGRGKVVDSRALGKGRAVGPRGDGVGGGAHIHDHDGGKLVKGGLVDMISLVLGLGLGLYLGLVLAEGGAVYAGASDVDGQGRGDLHVVVLQEGYWSRPGRHDSSRRACEGDGMNQVSSRVESGWVGECLWHGTVRRR